MKMTHTWMLEKRGRPKASLKLNIFESAQQRGRRESAQPHSRRPDGKARRRTVIASVEQRGDAEEDGFGHTVQRRTWESALYTYMPRVWRPE